MLICDNCDLGYHCDCLEPSLHDIPDGDWLCPTCSAAGDIDLDTTEQSAKGRRDITLDQPTLYYLKYLRHRPDSPPAVKRRAQTRAQRYFIHKDKLHFRSNKKFGPRIVPSISDRQGIIESLHSLGHFGVQRTANLVQERYFWAGIFQDVTQHVELCLECRHRNITYLQPPVLKSIPVNDQAFYRVGIDLLGPITETTRGNRYIAVAVDYLTKWAEVRAIPDKKSMTVAQFFEEDIIARHGCPRIVLSDNGLEFKGDFSDLLVKYGIDHHFTTPNHPQTNGLTERHNGTIVNSLNRMVGSDTTSWDMKLPKVLLGYRSTLQTATKVSPFYMVYARHPLLPVELCPRIQTDPEQHNSSSGGVRDLDLDKLGKTKDSEEDISLPQVTIDLIEELEELRNISGPSDYLLRDDIPHLQAADHRRQRMENDVTPKILANIQKAQIKNQKDYEAKRLKNKKRRRDEPLKLHRGDYVVLAPRGRPAKIQKQAEVFKIEELGTNSKDGKVLLVDNSTPPNYWWESATNIGIFKQSNDTIFD